MSRLSSIEKLEFTGNWSFSSLINYENCAHRFKLAKIDRMPEPPRPPDNPLERGNRIHKQLEDYIQGKTSKLVCEARNLEPLMPMYDHMRVLYQAGMVTIEQDWLFDRDWEVTSKEARCELHGRKEYTPDCPACRMGIWLWSKLDTCVLDEANATAIPGDHKSGKSQYKAYDHVQQLQLYAAITALKYPWAETIIPELYYVDEGWVKQSTYTREQALAFVGRFDIRAQKIFDDRFFRANPNVQTCRYCPYGPKNGTGACPVGV